MKVLDEVVKNKIRKELEGGQLLGPHSSLPLPDLRITPLGVVPEKTFVLSQGKVNE